MRNETETETETEPAPLRLENARFDREQGYPILRVEVEGRPVLIPAEWKPQLRDAGIVRVGDDLADLLPPINWRTDEHSVTELRGFTRDRRMVALYRLFWDATDSGHYAVGPVTIPD